MPALDTRTVLLLCLVELPILLALLWVLRKLLRTQVPNDQVLFVMRRNKEVPYMPGASYWRRPKDRVARTLLISEQNYRAVVPHIVVGSGLPVDVTLRFSASLAVDHEEHQERLFDDTKRHETVVSVLRPHLQRLVEKILRSPTAPMPSGLGMGAFLHPLFGETLPGILKSLHFHARQDLKRHGILLGDQTLNLESLTLASGIVKAYHDLERSRYEEVQRFQFVKRVEVISPGVSEQALVQLYHAAHGPSGPLHAVLSTGVIPADRLVADRNADVALFGEPESPQASLSSLAPKQDYPLTVEDMRLLKDLGA